MIENETPLHKRLNDTKIDSYRSPYVFPQGAKLIPHSQL